MRLFRAIAISVCAHAVLGVALALCLHQVPPRVTLAELDLSSVDLSFAETVEETAPVMPAPAAPPDSPPPRPQEAPMPPRPKYEVTPDRPGDAVLPVPKDPVERMETPKLVEPPPDETPPEAVERPVEKPVEKPLGETALRSTPPVPPVAPAPRQARVDAQPRPKRAIRPEYPKRARERGEEGDVTLLIAVAADGTVASASVAKTSGFADLDEAAVRAARAARFAPARLGDAPVDSMARLTLSFRLR